MEEAGDAPRREEPREPPRPAPPPAKAPPPRREPTRPPQAAGLAPLLRGLLPKGTDPGDLLLIVLLLLLYLEKEDEEYLIALFALIAMGSR